MIPRSERVLFHVDRSPSSPPRKQLSALEKGAVNPAFRSTARTSKRWMGNSPIAAVQDPRQMRTLAPATPWPPRLLRKTTAATLGDEHDEQPSPLDRKVPSTLKLGSKLEPGLPSSAPTSATLTSACEKEEGEVQDVCRREGIAPMAPKLEQREFRDAGDRWGMLRSDLAVKAATAFPPEHPRGPSLRQAAPAMKPVYAQPPYATFGSNEAACRSSMRRAETCLTRDQTNETNIYVNGLPKEMNDDMLYLLGSACGVVISHKAMMDQHTGLCKGFGFLMYASSDMAKNAIGWLSSHGFTSSFAKESFSARLRRMADSSSTNVYLSNLPIKFTVSQLEQLFNPHPIASLKMLYDQHGESRGVAFVRLYDRETAKLCIERLHGRMLPGTTVPLQVRFADSEAQKQLKLSVQQKHTLESLGLMDAEAWGPFGTQPGFDGGDRMHWRRGEWGRARTASELDGSVSRSWQTGDARASPFEGASSSTQQPFFPIPRMQPMPEPARGLGIEIPSHVPMTHAQPGQAVSPTMWALASASRIVYPSMEGGYALEGAFHRSPVDIDGWETHRGDMTGSLYPPVVAPTARMHSSRSRNDPPTHTEDRAPSRPTRRHKSNAAVRVRVPSTKATNTGARAVSDPMAVVAAQTRVREALGLPDRVRAAVSADNSLDLEAKGSTTDDASSNSEVEEDDDDDDDSMSIDIQVHTDRQGS